MLPDSYFEEWRDVRAGTLACARLVDDDRLDFAPGPGLSSLGELNRHINGAVYFMLTRVMGRQVPLPEKIRDKKPLARDEFIQELENTDRLVRGLLEELELGDLDKKAPGAVDSGKDWTIGYLVWHLKEHEVHHRSQLKFYLKMLGQDTAGVGF